MKPQAPRALASMLMIALATTLMPATATATDDIPSIWNTIDDVLYDGAYGATSWIPGPERGTFVWSERTTTMHELVDVSGQTEVTVTIPVDTHALLDLEVTGLSARTFYNLIEPGSGENWSSWSNGNGMAVFWALPADDWTWDLLEGETQIATIVIDVIVDSPPPPETNALLCDCPARGTYYPWKQVFLEGDAINQAAMSWADDAVVTTTGCFQHAVRIDESIIVSAGGGQKAGAWGTAGGDYQYEMEYCDTISSRLYTGDASQTVERNAMDFQVDTYEDWSRKFYAIGHGGWIIIEPFDLPAPQREEVDEIVALGPYQTFTRMVRENSAGGVYFGSGASATLPGYVPVTFQTTSRFSATDQYSSNVNVQIINDEPVTRYFIMKFVNGNQYTTGLVGLVCECFPPTCGTPDMAATDATKGGTIPAIN